MEMEAIESNENFLFDKTGTLQQKELGDLPVACQRTLPTK
jgi:hypothetical protein